MARADIDAAVTDLGKLYKMSFGGKRMGRFTVNRDQLAILLRIKVAQDKTILLLTEAALNDADLVLAQSAGGLYSVVAAPKAARWRKVPRAILSDLLGPTVAVGNSARDDEDGEDNED